MSAPESGDESPLALVIGKLAAEECQPKRGGGDQWSARCPAHGDREASLSIGEGDDGRALLNCHAGCEIGAIVRALDITLRDLYPRSSWSPDPPARRSRTQRPPAGPDDGTFGFLPACLLENADAECVRLYGLLALRCGRDNRRQRGWKQLAQTLGVDWRTLRNHGEYLAGLGWIHVHAQTTATGAHKAVEIWLAHCPPLKIRRDDVRTPSRDHAKTRGGSVVQPARPLPEKVATTVAPPVSRTGAFVARAGLRCGATDAPLSRYVEVVDTSVLDTSRAPLLTEGEAVAAVLAAFPGAVVVGESAA